MKLRNKETGEVWDIGKVLTNDYPCWETLEQLNEDWEDYEDDDLSKIIRWLDKGLEDEILPISVNEFVEKLKAWKQLKDTITCIDIARYGDVGTATLFIRYKKEDHKEVLKYLDLLFGGEK